MDDLVVRQGEHEILGERIEHAERELVVMIAAIERVLGDVRQRVMHPAHVPFEAEAEPAEIGRPRHHRPGG